MPEAGMGRLTAYNLLSQSDLDNCGNLEFRLKNGEETTLFNMGIEGTIYTTKDLGKGTYTVDSPSFINGTCNDYGFQPLSSIVIEEETSTDLLIYKDTSTNTVFMQQSEYNNELEKPSGGSPFVKILWSHITTVGDGNQNLTLKFKGNLENTDRWETIEIGSNIDIGDSDPRQVSK